MVWNSAPFQEHIKKLSKQMNRQAFWKTALFGVLILERQWPVYERLSIGREWDAAKEIRKVLDRLWKAIPTGLRIGDNFWLILEENPVKITESWDAVAALMLDDCLHVMKTFQKKDTKAAGELAERNLIALAQFLSACGEEGNFAHPLFQAEMDFQNVTCQRLCTVSNSEKTTFINTCMEEKVGSISGDLWFPNYPDYKPLKKKRKKLPVLRYTHLRYDEYVEEAKQPNEQGLNDWDQEKMQFELYDAWLNWSEQMPNDCNIPLIEYTINRWPMPESLAEIYDYFSLSIKLAAQSCWACTEDPELVRGMFWLSARAQEASYALLEKGWPCSQYLSYENSLHKTLTGPAYYAICAGDWDLAVHLLNRWHHPLTLCGKLAPWRNIPATKVWLALVQEEDEKARFLIEQETQSKRPPTNDERLWPHLYPWDYWEEDCETFLLLLNRDKKGLEKEIISGIRSIRAQYEQSLTTLAPYNLTLWKLARRRGMELDLPPVSEMPAELLEDIPLNREKWKLPGQAILDKALGPQGMELLNHWKHLSTAK